MSVSENNLEAAAGASDVPAPKKINPVLKFLLILVVVPVMVFRKSQKALSEAVYEGFFGGFRLFLGVVTGLAAGIGAGYYLGWLCEAHIKYWLPAGVVSLLATYVYIWPLTYLIAIKPLFRLSEKLWEAVLRYKGRASWFTWLLNAVGCLAIIGGCLYLGYEVFGTTKAHAAASWGAASWLAWPASIIAGLFVAWLTGMFLFKVVVPFFEDREMVLAAIVGGGALTYGFAGQARELVAPILDWLGLPPSLTWGAYFLEMLLFVGYIFPLTHVFMTHVLGRLPELLGRLSEKVYGYAETGSEYRQFFAQLVNIGASCLLATGSLWLWALLALAPLVAVVLTGVVAILSYTLLGQWLRACSNRLVGNAAMVVALASTNILYTAAGLWFGFLGAIAASVAAAVLSYWIFFPLAYVMFRFVAQLTRLSLLGKPLTWLHDTVVDGWGRLFDEMARALEKTYGDSTPYRELFLHLANLAAVAGIFFGSLKLSAVLGFAAWLAWSVTAVVAAAAYVLAGKLLLKAGNWLVGLLVSLAAGVVVGTLSYAQLASGFWWLVLAVGFGLVAALLTGFLVFPVVYVLARWPANWALCGWLRPALVSAHTWVWNSCADVWEECRQVYNAVEAWFKPYWDNIAKTWNDTWESVRQWWAESTGSRR